jgi:hypothetical protein
MGNPLRGEATFTAGSEQKTLVFDINVFCELEADTGLGVNELVAQVQGNPSFTLLRSIFCAALQVKHPGTTKAEAGAIMSDAGMDELNSALERALRAALPEAKEGGENPPMPAKTGQK